MKIRLFVHGNSKKSGQNFKKNKEKIQISVGKAEKQGKIAKNGKKAGKKNFKKKEKILKKYFIRRKKWAKLEKKQEKHSNFSG